MMAAIQYEMEVLGEEDGHTCVEKKVLRSALKMLVPEVINLFDEFIEEERINTILEKPNVLYVDENRCGLYRTYLMEKFIYEKLETIRTNNNIYDTEDFDGMVQKANDYLGFVLDEQQQKIIKSIATNNVTAITGKAGTGKTSLVKGILSVYENQNKSFAICTLAAKAARRVVEVTGFRDAKTIHRTLEFNPVEGFVKNEDNILFVDILIIDEASMVNVFLFYSILKALPNKCKVIIVGDNMQLPPIGSGAPFTDILNNSTQFNILKLAKIYRQAEDSGIVTDANKIRDGIMPFDKIEPFMIRGVKRDMLYLFKNKREDIQKAILDIFMEYIKKGVNVADVNVELPRKDDCLNSTKQINTKLQALLIPQGSPFLQVTSNKLFYLGDRVLNTSNNYSKDVMNGEIGTVTNVMSNSIVIDFDGNEIEFSKEECDALELGYALTVHKMQGSSNKYIIIGLDNTHRIKTLLSSNSIYTAATRAEIKCVIIAEPSAFRYGVHNTSENERQTFLPDFLK
jgi:exodeoxyribonuclease V alpha subunit